MAKAVVDALGCQTCQARFMKVEGKPEVAGTTQGSQPPTSKPHGANATVNTPTIRTFPVDQLWEATYNVQT